MRWLEQATSDVSNGLYVLALLILLTLLLVVIILVVVVWSKFAALPFGAKVLVFVAIGIVFLIVALIVGWVAEAQVREFWTGLLFWTTDKYRRFDGFTRQYPWVGMVLLAIVPFLCWPSDNEEEE